MRVKGDSPPTPIQTWSSQSPPPTRRSRPVHSVRRYRRPRAAAGVERLVAGVEPPSFRPILARCLSGAVSPQVALMQMVCESESAAVVRAAVDEVTARTDAQSRADDSIVRDRVDDLTRILVDHEDGVDRIVDMLRSNVDSSALAATVEEGIAFCERLFDWSVQQSEEASVALYSLASPELLGRATEEGVGQLGGGGGG